MSDITKEKAQKLQINSQTEIKISWRLFVE